MTLSRVHSLYYGVLQFFSYLERQCNVCKCHLLKFHSKLFSFFHLHLDDARAHHKLKHFDMRMNFLLFCIFLCLHSRAAGKLTMTHLFFELISPLILQVLSTLLSCLHYSQVINCFWNFLTFKINGEEIKEKITLNEFFTLILSLIFKCVAFFFIFPNDWNLSPSASFMLSFFFPIYYKFRVMLHVINVKKFDTQYSLKWHWRRAFKSKFVYTFTLWLTV